MFMNSSARMSKSHKHGSVVIAAITFVYQYLQPVGADCRGCWRKRRSKKDLIGSGLGKTSLAPGSKVVSDYLEHAGLMPYLEKLKFHLVGYGCTTCIGNSGPLPAEVSRPSTTRIWWSPRCFPAIATSKGVSIPKFAQITYVAAAGGRVCTCWPH